MINPNNPKHLRRLFKSVVASRREMKPFRMQTARTVSQMTGAHHGQDADMPKRPVPVNMI